MRGLAQSLQSRHGQNLRGCRLSKNLKQRELASELGISQQTLSFWETGRSAIPDAYKVRIGELLDADPTGLFPLTRKDTPRAAGIARGPW